MFEREELLSGVHGFRHSRFNRLDKRFIDGNPMVLQGVGISSEPFVIYIRREMTRNNCDISLTLFKQVFYSFDGSPVVIEGDANQIFHVEYIIQ
ncbi:hypothetical protein SDC9_198968 [bioreactor metagenome]|uniref:Uncharacterized protein n=1 Tax=bioreactor metagenome TaxID=1076179 RepID=A0A645IJ59_9ZZZZ